MKITKHGFNAKIGQKYILLEALKMNIFCPVCNKAIQEKLDEIQKYLEDGCKSGVIL